VTSLDALGAIGITAESLDAADVIPPDALAVYVSGSYARGWANAASDVDIYVVTREDHEWTHGQPRRRNVALDPAFVRCGALIGDGPRWELEYWREEQVDQLFAKVTWDVLERPAAAGDDLTVTEVAFLDRLGYALALAGADWVSRRREEMEGSALRVIMVSRHLNDSGSLAEDALGQLEADDHESATLSAQLAFGRLVDAVLAHHGRLAQGQKWRARQMRDAAPDILPFDEYWSVATMRDLDPDAPGAWIRRVLELCQRVQIDLPIR
jgi:hypothetical protein